MRSFGEIEESIRNLEEDKNSLTQIASLLKTVGESLLNSSTSLINLSDILFEGYSVDNSRIDGNIHEKATEYKGYAEKLLALADRVLSEVSILEGKISDERVELEKARQREAAEEERRRREQIMAAQRKKEGKPLNQTRYLAR